MRSTHAQQQWGFGILGLALSTPVVYLMLGLPLLMRQHRWSGTEIGVSQLAGLPDHLCFYRNLPLSPAGKVDKKRLAAELAFVGSVAGVSA